MKNDTIPIIVGLPQAAKTQDSDQYLSEMTDRLHRLRSLMGAIEKPRKRASSKKPAKVNAPAY